MSAGLLPLVAKVRRVDFASGTFGMVCGALSHDDRVFPEIFPETGTNLHAVFMHPDAL